jgi:hypothetical protein
MFIILKSDNVFFTKIAREGQAEMRMSCVRCPESGNEARGKHFALKWRRNITFNEGRLEQGIVPYTAIDPYRERSIRVRNS